MTQSIVLAGASGFIGSHLVRRFEEDGSQVRTIGRSPRADARWDEDLRAVLGTARMDEREHRDHLSRRAGSTAGRGHGGAGERILRRSRPGLGARTLGCAGGSAEGRAAHIVLGTGGATNPNINLARMGFGGRQGDGGQVMSWIHIEDVYRAVQHIIDHSDLSGPINLASPQAVTNGAFMRGVRRHLGGPSRIGARLPTWSLEAGARIIRTEAELVLKSRWVEPHRLTQSGFTFTHPGLDTALAEIAGRTGRGFVPVQVG